MRSHRMTRRDRPWPLYLIIGVSVMVTVIGWVLHIDKSFEVGRDIGAPLNRAEVAANPGDMDRLLAEVQTGMEKHGYTEGHWQPYNQNEDNDFAEAYNSIQSMRTRLADVTQWNPESVEYQTAMNDLRGTIKALNIGQQIAVQWEFWWVYIASAVLALSICWGVCNERF